MSPRAAWRLERLGFTVYDYTLGKVDWRAGGLDTVRNEPGPARAIDAIDREVSTCSPATPVVHLDARTAPHVVVNEQGIVLGRVRARDLEDADPKATAEEVMQPGPATVRADADLGDTRERLRRAQVPAILVTTPEGKLLGSLSAGE